MIFFLSLRFPIHAAKIGAQCPFPATIGEKVPQRRVVYIPFIIYSQINSVEEIAQYAQP